MKLYHATTVYQFLNVVAHVQKNQSFGQDILLLSLWMKEKFKDIKILKNFFKKVLFYNASIHNFEQDKFEQAIDKELSTFFSQNAINPSKFDEIVVGGVQYNLGLYLCMKGIPFSVVEESCGIYSHPEILYNIDKNIPNNKSRVELAKKLNVYDCSNKAITKVYCDIDEQANNFKSDKMVDFKVLEILKTLDKSMSDLLISMFGIESKIELEKDSVFLLTQQFSSLNIMDFKSHILIYQLFTDFLLKDKKLFIKPHPDDACYYSQFLKNAIVIRERFPSELSPFVFENLPKTIATISSTGIKPLGYLFDEKISLDFEYEKSFRNTLRYYTVIEYISKLGIKNCKLVGVNTPLFSNLSRAMGISLSQEIISTTDTVEFSENTAVVIDVCSHDDKYIENLILQGFDLYIFINSKNDYAFYRFELKEKIRSLFPIVIKKTKQREEDNYLDYENEMFFAYSENKEIYKSMKNIIIEKELENTGASFKVDSLTDEQMEIVRLKGVLAATEKRLLYYINKEKEMNEQ